MDELINGSCSITTTTYGDYYNSSYNDTFIYDISDDDDVEFNYASQPFQEFMDCNHSEEKTEKKAAKTERKSVEKKEKEEDEEEGEEEKEKEEELNCKNRKNLIIWDWDDTIFPTYSFRTHEDEKDKLFMSKLNTLVSYIEQIFIKMMELYDPSNIIIVTNASETWINKCLNVDIVQDIFMNFQNLLKKYEITTISASTREITSKFPKNPHKWKEIIFGRYFGEYFNDTNEERINCITSIGDSLCEYNASHIASKYIPNRILNRIRLKPNPSINDMISQLKEILTMIDQFGNNLDDIEIDYSSIIPLTCSDSTC